jgi:hypothetical protein
MTVFLDWLALIGPLSVSAALFILGLLSRRLGRVTQARPYYAGFFAASLLVAGSALVRLQILRMPPPDAQEIHTVLALYNGLFSTGVTLGVIIAWRYWSWLLAERD